MTGTSSARILNSIHSFTSTTSRPRVFGDVSAQWRRKLRAELRLDQPKIPGDLTSAQIDAIAYAHLKVQRAQRLHTIHEVDAWRRFV